MSTDAKTTDRHFSPTGEAFVDDEGRCTCEPVPIDRPTTATVRECLVADGSLQEVSFEEWCDQLRALGRRDDHRYGPDPIANCGAECWREYYNDGYTATGAWAEDGTYD